MHLESYQVKLSYFSYKLKITDEIMRKLTESRLKLCNYIDFYVPFDSEWSSVYTSGFLFN